MTVIQPQQFIDSSQHSMTAIQPRTARQLFVKNCPAEFDTTVTSSAVRSLAGSCSFYSVGMRKDSQTKLPCQLDTAVNSGVFSGHGKHRGSRPALLSYVAGVFQRHATEAFLF
jgi:hypothetical protein